MTLARLTFSQLFLEYDSDTALQSAKSPYADTGASVKAVLKHHTRRERKSRWEKAFVHHPLGLSLEKEINMGYKVLMATQWGIRNGEGNPLT